MAQLKKLPGLTAVMARDIVSVREKTLFNRPIELRDFEKIPIVQQLCESGHLVLRAEGASFNTLPSDADETGDRLEQLENRFCRLEERVESLASVSDRERQSSNVRLDGMQTSLNSILEALQNAGIGASPRNVDLQTIDPTSEHQVVNTNVRSVSPAHSVIAQGGYSNTLGSRYYAPGSHHGGPATHSGPTAHDEFPPVQTENEHRPRPEGLSRAGPPLPKYTGALNWAHFEVLVDRARLRGCWPPDFLLDNVVDSFQGEALEYYCMQPVNVRESYPALAVKMGKRFGRLASEKTLQKQLFAIRQVEEEPLQEFADRVMRFATGGYPQFPEAACNAVAMVPFFNGCRSQSIALKVMGLNPTTVDKAVDLMLDQESNEQVFAVGRPRIRAVQHWPDDEYEYNYRRCTQPRETRGSYNNPERARRRHEYTHHVTDPAIRSVHDESLGDRVKKVESEVTLLHGQVANNSSRVDKLSDRMRQRSGRNFRRAARGDSSGGSKSRDSSRERNYEDYQCYSCGEWGHIAWGCPRNPEQPSPGKEQTLPNQNGLGPAPATQS